MTYRPNAIPTHDPSCENATQERCVCSCDGAYHRIAAIRKQPEDRVLGDYMGGEIADLIKRCQGTVPVGLCPHEIPIGSWLGYPHPGGIPDATGETWWAYVECPTCGYCASWWKVERRMAERELIR